MTRWKKQRRQKVLHQFGVFLWVVAAAVILCLGHAMGSRVKSAAMNGRVHISLKDEEGSLENGIRIPGKEERKSREKSGEGKEIQYVMPGETVQKKTEITVKKGSGTAWLRVKLLACGITGAQQEDLLENMETDSSWYYQKEDGYFYYQEPVREGERVIFAVSVRVPREWEKLEKSLCFQLNVAAEAMEEEYLHVEMARGNVYGWK